MRNVRVVAIGFAVLAVCGLSVDGGATDLVPNPGFEESIDFHPRDWRKGLTVWRFYEIVLPIEGKIDLSAAVEGKRSFRFTGSGKALLHSGFFSVKPSTRLKIRFYAKGTAPKAEVFWWVKEGVEADKEKFSRVALKRGKARGGWTLYEGEATSAPDAQKAYLRIIAEGNMSVDAVSVVEAK